MPLPQLLRAVQPDMRVVVMLRDPVERMYSAFWYYGCLYNVYKDYGMTPKGFHKLVTVRPRLASEGVVAPGDSMGQEPAGCCLSICSAWPGSARWHEGRSVWGC